MINNTYNIHKRLEHIYDAHRTALMNQKYYRYKINRLKKYNFSHEILIAIGASSSGIMAWPLWEEEYGKLIWAIIAGTAAVLSIAKPLVNWSKKIEEHRSRFDGYTMIYYELNSIKQDIEFKQQLTSEHDLRYDKAANLFQKIAVAETDLPSKKLLDRCYDEVNKEHPAESYWMPK